MGSLLRRLRPLIPALLVAGAAWTSVPRLAVSLRDSLRLAPLPYAERRARVVGPFHASARAIDRELPPGERLAIVSQTLDDSFRGLFAAYYLYPRDVRNYNRLSSWRNAPHRPETLALSDGRMPEEIRHLAYIDIRRRLFLTAPLTASRSATPESLTHFVVPFAGSLDGAGEGDVYTTEAVLQSNVRTEVRVTLYPQRLTKAITLEANEPRRFADVIGELYDRLDAGWIEVVAREPVRSAFWYVDRGRRQVEPLPALTEIREKALRFEGPAEKVYVLNPADRDAEITLNGVPRRVPARGLTTFPAQPANRVFSTTPVYGFTTRRDARGWTYFGWPR